MDKVVLLAIPHAQSGVKHQFCQYFSHTNPSSVSQTNPVRPIRSDQSGQTVSQDKTLAKVFTQSTLDGNSQHHFIGMYEGGFSPPFSACSLKSHVVVSTTNGAWGT